MRLLRLLCIGGQQNYHNQLCSIDVSFFFDSLKINEHSVKKEIKKMSRMLYLLLISCITIEMYAMNDLTRSLNSLKDSLVNLEGTLKSVQAKPEVPTSEMPTTKVVGEEAYLNALDTFNPTDDPWNVSNEMYKIWKWHQKPPDLQPGEVPYGQPVVSQKFLNKFKEKFPGKDFRNYWGPENWYLQLIDYGKKMVEERYTKESVGPQIESSIKNTKKEYDNYGMPNTEISDTVKRKFKEVFGVEFKEQQPLSTSK